MHMPIELFNKIIDYLGKRNRVQFLTTPLSRNFVHVYGYNEILWSKLCQGIEWMVPRTYIPMHSFRHLYQDLTLTSKHIKDGNVETLCKTMSKYRDIPKMMIHCISLLGDLAIEEENRKLIGEVNIIDMILCCMKQNMEYAEMQFIICKSLVTIARPFGGAEGGAFRGNETSTMISTKIGSRGGVELVIKAMQTHPYDSGVQAMACWSLVNLSLGNGHKKLILALGGFELIIFAMRAHPKEKSVQFRAIFALVNLVISVQNTKDIPSDTVSLILRAMQEHRFDEALISRACLVLRNMTMTEISIRLLCNEDVYDELQQSLSLYMQSKFIQSLIVYIFRRIRMFTQQHLQLPTLRHDLQLY